MSFEKIEQLCGEYHAKIVFNEPMSKHTSFKIGGPCDALVCVNSIELLTKLIKACGEEKIKYYILGKGSNVLISDKGLRGLVIVISSDFSHIEVQGEYLICDAGATLAGVCNAALKESLTGIEFAYGIPGTVGGALFMNAGAYGGVMEDIVVSCRYLDNNCEVKEITLADMALAYRHSIFFEKNYIILSVTFKLEKGDKAKIYSRMNELMERRRDKQPLEYPSAGSTFKRPEGDFAARLIEVCGLKGTSCGGAEVSTKHSGFVINKNNASFDDVMGVVEVVKDKVYEQTGVKLECEMLIIE